MWACLQDHDTTGHWKQVAGWRKVSELALTHLSRLKEYRRGLAEAWPPETNAAARAYIGELDQLIDKVQRTHDTAAANYDALAAATRALGSTRAELEPLYQEYAAKLQQKQAYEATVADPKAVAGSRLPEQPPVTDGDLERLNVQARGLMTGLSGELQQAQVMLRTPPPAPRTWPGREQVDPDVYGTPATPVIPPIVAVPVVKGGATSSGSRRSAAARVAPAQPQPGAGLAVGPGPVLGGAGTGLAPAPVTPGSIGSIPPATPSQPPVTAVGMTPSLPAISGLGGSGGGSRKTSLRDETGALGRSAFGGTSEQPHAAPARSMPPNGLIGGTPGMGLGQPAAGASPPRRVNPIGGVIGGGGAGTAPTGAAGSRPGAGRNSHANGLHGLSPLGGGPNMGYGSQAVGGAAPRPVRREQGEAGSRYWDLDHPWETDEGVTPVVRPPDDQGPIDPGPAIGFDR